MKREKWYKILMNGKPIDRIRGRENAEAYIRLMERQDRYEVEVEGYAVPAGGYPVYTIE